MSLWTVNVLAVLCLRTLCLYYFHFRNDSLPWAFIQDASFVSQPLLNDTS